MVEGVRIGAVVRAKMDEGAAGLCAYETKRRGREISPYVLYFGHHEKINDMSSAVDAANLLEADLLPWRHLVFAVVASPLHVC